MTATLRPPHPPAPAAERSSVGMVGGGQLARMTWHEASRLGLDMTVLDPDPLCPAATAGAAHLPGRPDDPDALRALAAGTDAVVLDHEQVPAAMLAELARDGYRVAPGPLVAGLAQDKARLRTWLQRNGLASPTHRVGHSVAGAMAAWEELGPAVVVKAARGGYDGRGVWVVEGGDEVTALASRLGTVVVEAHVPFTRELSVLVARGDDGTVAVHPVLETVQRDGMCREVLFPAACPPATRDAAERLAVELAERADLVGVMAVEMFEVGDDLLVNEIATRPHNSAHLTIEACATSQFEQYLRAALGLPLGKPRPLVPAACMVNVVGPDDGADPRRRLAAALSVPGARVHLYGKPARPGRKLGHVTAVGDDREAARQAARSAADLLEGRT